jgi:hypothetical protein
LIISASRRTDIPAFYTEWFFNRLKQGFAYVRNPMNYRQVSMIELNPGVIDCIVFWTKDPANILNKLDLLAGYHYYFQITVNAYDHRIERNVPDKNRIVQAFQALSGMIGKERTIWRYDPIILMDGMDMESHFRSFESLSAKLEGFTEQCIISFVDFYKKMERNMSHIAQMPIHDDMMEKMGERLYKIGRNHGMKVKACSEHIDLSAVGIEHAKCVDDQLISRIIGKPVDAKKDKNQRKACGCIESIDIGAYNSCRHGCLYCYANFSDNAVASNLSRHDPGSPLLIGNVEPEDVIKKREFKNVCSADIKDINRGIRQNYSE